MIVLIQNQISWEGIERAPSVRYKKHALRTTMFDNIKTSITSFITNAAHMSRLKNSEHFDKAKALMK